MIGFTQLNAPAAAIADRGAAAIVAAHRDQIPDLRDLVVLIPDLHAVSTVARAIQKASGVTTLLLPRITTLEGWTATVALETRVSPRSAREVALYQALSARRWLQGADLWAMATELGALFDEMTRCNVALASGIDDFSARLASAYAARPSASLQFEAQLVHELWWAMSRDTSELAPEAAHQLRLARLADNATAPLFAIGLEQLSPAERAFLERYAQRAPVTVISAGADADEAVGATLASAWPRKDSADLHQRARALRAAYRTSALAGRMRIFGATSPEEEAQAIDVRVREWLLAGKRSIGVIVQDRVVARRARALLERAGVLVADEAGWALSTTSAATVLGRWLDIVAADAYHRDLLDLMKSPFAFYDWPREQRRLGVWRLERYVREASVVTGIERYIDLAQARGDAEVRQILLRVQRAAALLTSVRKPLAGWLAALDASLAEIGVRAGLEADPAGEQLLELLSGLAHELSTSTARFSFSEWRRWLARELEAATFRDRGIESPVVFSYLAATSLRSFEATLVCGSDAQHLPGPNSSTRLFNQRVRAELGLPTRVDELRKMEAQLAALIAASGEILFTWQRQLAGEDNLLSPLLERLRALHLIAYGDDLAERTLASRIPNSAVSSPNPAALPGTTSRPQPALSPELLPTEISASGYNALIACPYQFYVRHVLKLGELDEVLELADKRDYGSRLHEVLAAFHREFPVVSEVPQPTAESTLRELIDRAFRAAIETNYLARAWRIQLQGLVPAYLAWQREREAQGWRWHAAEARRRIEITTPAGRTLVLVGRLDRVDKHTDGRIAVVDYKTSRQQLLRNKLKQPGEDVQLPLYALLWGGPVATALFLALERSRISEVPLEVDLAQLASANQRRLGKMYDRLHDGAPVPAHGIETVCEYCEARGLCRKDYWA